ncbi:MAG: polyprenyl synthetase family protein [Planctomycetota bacterium]
MSPSSVDVVEHPSDQHAALRDRIDAVLGAAADHPWMPANLRESVRYALLGPGKRLRPVLVMHSCEAVGGDLALAEPAAAAVEMIHAFSLVHDDLPALDDDDLRRGRPTAHIRFGEALALLAGDGLMSVAFQTLAEGVDDDRLLAELIRELAGSTTAMIAGQVLDTLGGFPPSLSEDEQLRLVHRNKTGALLRACCRMGALCARGDDASVDAMSRYGEAIGLMFQIVDDLLDVEQSAEHIGKQVNKDAAAGKLTFPVVLGVEASRAEVERLRRAALSAIERFGERGAALVGITEYLATRTR